MPVAEDLPDMLCAHVHQAHCLSGTRSLPALPTHTHPSTNMAPSAMVPEPQKQLPKPGTMSSRWPPRHASLTSPGGRPGLARCGCALQHVWTNTLGVLVSCTAYGQGPRTMWTPSSQRLMRRGRNSHPTDS